MTHARRCEPHRRPHTHFGSLQVRAQAALLSLAIVVASACGSADSTGPSEELTDVVLNFCSSPSMVAYQNQGGSWTNVPLASGPASFKAAAKTLVMVAWQLPGNANPRVDFFFGSGSELQLLGAHERCGPTTGSKTLLGSVANVDFERQRASVVMGSAGKFVLGPFPTFAITNVPAGPVDLVSTRRASTEATVSNASADKVIIRRATNLPDGSTMPVLDFAASEALSVASNTVTISGQGGDDLFMENDLITAAQTNAVLQDYSFFSGSAPLISVPSANLVTGDMHQLTLFALAESNDILFRGAILHYRGAGDKHLSLGPALSSPSVTVAGTTPYVRLRVQLPSQSDYPDFAQFRFTQSEGGGKSVSVLITKGYFGGTPASWDVTMPDASAVPGFQSSWMLQNGVATAWDGEAWLLALPWFFGGALTDGSLSKFATRSSPINTAAVTFRAPRSPGFGLLTPSMARSHPQR
jgi:hypothetical protein